MSGCLDFGAWTDAVRGELPSRAGLRAARHLLACSTCRQNLLEARRLLEHLTPSARSLDHERHEDLALLAAALAHHEFPPEAWECEDCTAILLGSLESTTPAGRHSRYWVIGSLAAAAAAAFVFVALGAPGQDWARTAGLRRGQLWLLPGPTAEEVRRVASGGGLTPPRFTLPTAPIEIERDPLLEPSAPRVLAPRWETSEEVRPEFHWKGSGGAAEIFLLDGDRKFLWSEKCDAAGRMPFPASAAPLVRGATYYWKVNLVDADGVRPSAYAGFTILSEEEAGRCREELGRSGASRFVEAVVAERCGLYTRAAAAFEAAARSSVAPGLATRLARELRTRQGLDDAAPRE